MSNMPKNAGFTDNSKIKINPKAPARVTNDEFGTKLMFGYMAIRAVWRWVLFAVIVLNLIFIGGVYFTHTPDLTNSWLLILAVVFLISLAAIVTQACWISEFVIMTISFIALIVVLLNAPVYQTQGLPTCDSEPCRTELMGVAAEERNVYYQVIKN